MGLPWAPAPTTTAEAGGDGLGDAGLSGNANVRAPNSDFRGRPSFPLLTVALRSVCPPRVQGFSVSDKGALTGPLGFRVPVKEYEIYI